MTISMRCYRQLRSFLHAAPQSSAIVLGVWRYWNGVTHANKLTFNFFQKGSNSTFSVFAKKSLKIWSKIFYQAVRNKQDDCDFRNSFQPFKRCAWLLQLEHCAPPAHVGVESKCCKAPELYFSVSGLKKSKMRPNNLSGGWNCFILILCWEK